ncbi:hypothetical protein [Nocardioides convexus]|uniref:hypothetical protein n=1 Tax=Nocardioides convexus TaxID=2712224 RepID=UPI0024185E56|nr:hypothetical protein [Nocardioides convexus]
MLTLLYLGWYLVVDDRIAAHRQTSAATELEQRWDDAATPAPEPSAPRTGEAFATIRVPRFGTQWRREVVEGTGLDEPGPRGRSLPRDRAAGPGRQLLRRRAPAHPRQCLHRHRPVAHGRRGRRTDGGLVVRLPRHRPRDRRAGRTGRDRPGPRHSGRHAEPSADDAHLLPPALRQQPALRRARRAWCAASPPRTACPMSLRQVVG